MKNFIEGAEFKGVVVGDGYMMFLCQLLRGKSDVASGLAGNCIAETLQQFTQILAGKVSWYSMHGQPSLLL